MSNHVLRAAVVKQHQDASFHGFVLVPVADGLPDFKDLVLTASRLPKASLQFAQPPVRLRQEYNPVGQHSFKAFYDA